MADENQVPEGQRLTPVVAQSKFGIEMTKKFGNYQEALNQMRNASVTEANLEEAQQYLKNVNKFLKGCGDIKDDMRRPGVEEEKSIMGAFKVFVTPFEIEKNALQEKVNRVAQEKAKRVAIENGKKIREVAINNAMNEFILSKSVEIASATSNEQLISIERLINLEKANKSRYVEFLPLLIERCNELNGKLSDQKQLIKERERLEREKLKAVDDDEKMQEILIREQIISNKIADNTVLVQEQAASSMLLAEELELEEVKPRRTVWKAEIQDVKEVMKKAPQMLDISLNADKVREAISTLKDSGSFKGKTEIVVNGIRYFESKTF